MFYKTGCCPSVLEATGPKDARSGEELMQGFQKFLHSTEENDPDSADGQETESDDEQYEAAGDACPDEQAYAEYQEDQLHECSECFSIHLGFPSPSFHSVWKVVLF
jgi:hypothetical protein